MTDTGFYDLIYSPDDADESGRGWYAKTINRDGSCADESSLFATRREAERWARAHGGTRILTERV